jgi:hypothetical protein
LGVNLVQLENVGEIPLVCASVVEKTMGRFDFQQELLRELSGRTFSRERAY